jgi:hypothetical protein
MTPYLVGLLVMLGMLGTFVGMVDTLKGAVSALEGSTELDAIRAGLAAPIKGLGMAFGTSVAGVAASAMLGFISTLSRRERMLASRLLDQKTPIAFQAFSLAYNRQQAFRAMQSQADTLPAVAARLEQLSARLENLGEQIGQQLVANQAQFHDSAKTHYQELARSVGQSLQENLAQSGKLAGESLQPMVSHLLQQISDMTTTLQQQTANSLQQQVLAISREFSNTSAEVSSAWQAGIASHQQNNAQMQASLHTHLESMASAIKADSNRLLDGINTASHASLEHIKQQEQARFNAWLDSVNASQQASATALETMAARIAEQMQTLGTGQQANLQSIADHFSATASAWMEQWQTTSLGNLDQQQQLLAALEATSGNIASIQQHTADSIGTNTAQLLATSEQLLAARSHQETTWLDAFNSRMASMIEIITGKLDQLHAAELERTAATVQQFAMLQQVAGEQLASLGAALETPMTNLISIASETPRAAAEVIEQLRGEISNNIERDNSLLEERRQIMADLHTLNSTIAAASVQQQEAVAGMVAATNASLLSASQQFGDNINHQLASMTNAIDHVTGSALELSSLGEAFTVAVELFSGSNTRMQESLAQIQQALQEANARHDEQLAYYVAQAREVIDHSMLSQQEMIRQIRQPGHTPATTGEHA